MAYFKLKITIAIRSSIGFGVTFFTHAITSSRSATKKYADIIIPQGGNNEKAIKALQMAIQFFLDK